MGRDGDEERLTPRVLDSDEARGDIALEKRGSRAYSNEKREMRIKR